MGFQDESLPIQRADLAIKDREPVHRHNCDYTSGRSVDDLQLESLPPLDFVPSLTGRNVVQVLQRSALP